MVGPARRDLCIDRYESSTGLTTGCGTNRRIGGGAIDATAVERGPSITVQGALSSAVARVVLRYELGGHRQEQAAVVVAAGGSRSLRELAVADPFGLYVAELPAGARAAVAEARDARGRRIGVAFFDGFRGPTGEGRICDSRPRISSLRLLEPARAGHSSRLRVVARYRGGSIRSVDVRVPSRTLHVDLVPPRTRAQAGLRVVTLPVRFTRGGTVGIDVTAEGVPLDPRCGRNPPPRRSLAQTLVVRVR